MLVRRLPCVASAPFQRYLSTAGLIISELVPMTCMFDGSMWLSTYCSVCLPVISDCSEHNRKTLSWWVETSGHSQRLCSVSGRSTNCHCCTVQPNRIAAWPVFTSDRWDHSSGCFAASIGSYLPTFRDNLSGPIFKGHAVDCLTSEDEEWRVKYLFFSDVLQRRFC